MTDIPDPQRLSLPREELMAAPKEKKVVLDLPPRLLSLKEELSATSRPSKDQDEAPTSPPSLFTELAAAAELPTRGAPNHSHLENDSAAQHGETQAPSHERTERQTSEHPECHQASDEKPVEGIPPDLTDRTPPGKDPTACAEMAELSAGLLEGSWPLGKRVQKIQAALSAATRHSHCASCLQDKKNQAPELLCLECSLAYCFRCSGQHKSAPATCQHTLVPVDQGPDAQASEPRSVSCSTHRGTELSLFCRNCEVLACSLCLAEQHDQCPGTVPLHQYASEEREAIKKCRVKYAQVMRFFSEQKRDTEERIASLTSKKQSTQAEIRKFFSALIKACIDVEGSLLEEMETTVSDHMDLLTEQSSAWHTLQETTQKLLDVTDIMHFLPNADFLPLMEASKASLSQALRDGETLGASAPPEMSIELCLEQSSLRSVIKRIKEIGATALTINTHKTLTLGQVSSMSFKTAEDKTDPLVTAMLLLSHNTLVAADFNNSCLKRFLKEDEGEFWNCTEVLPLKWRPYGLTKVSEEHVTVTEMLQQDAPDSEQKEFIVISAKTLVENAEKRVPVGKQVRDGSEASGATDVEIHLAVTSPFAGCFDVVVPASGNRKMHVSRAISEEKGFWGVSVVSEHKLAVSALASGRCYITLIDTAQNSIQRLPLTSHTSLTPLVSPRHILPTSPSSIMVGDHGKKAVIHASTDGKVLSTFFGNGSQRVSRPEGMCVDSQGHVYVADSGDHSIFVLTKGGHLFSRTGSPQSELHHPQALCMDRNSRLFVANERGKVLSVYEVFQERC